MKIIIIILLFFSLNLSAQLRGLSTHKFPESAKVILTYTGAVALNAIGDGLNDNGVKGWGHVANALSIGTLLMSFTWIDYDRTKWWVYPLTYVSVRFAGFDYIYNTTRGLPLNYIGGTSFYDQFMQKLNPPETYLMRGCALVVSISIPIKFLK